MLDGEGAIPAGFAGRDFKVSAQGVRHRVGPCKGAHWRAAYAYDGAARGLQIEHLVEIDDTTNVGERHSQGAAHFGGNRFGNPAKNFLGSVQSRQKRGAALGRQLGKGRAQGKEFVIGHFFQLQ